MLSLVYSGEANKDQISITEDVTMVNHNTTLEANLTLPIKRLFDASLLAYGCVENSLMDTVELSKTIM